MNEIHTNWLTDGWEGVIEQGILNSTQGDKPLWDWVQSLQSTNALIVGTYAELDEPLLRTHIKSNLNNTVKAEANCKKTHTELDFQKWIAALKLLDDDCINDECKLREFMAKDRVLRCKNNHVLANPSCATNRTATTFTSNYNTNTPATNSTSPNANTTPCLPALTVNERTLLAANEGCYKCRKPFVNHHSPECEMATQTPLATNRSPKNQSPLPSLVVQRNWSPRSRPW